MDDWEWKYYFDGNGDRRLVCHDYPECWPGELTGKGTVEEMYQAFKARLLAETTGDTDAK